MHYKTMVLDLLAAHPDIVRLRRERVLLRTAEHYSTDLKSSHEAWQMRLLKTRPESDPSQIASEALEIALDELRTRLFSATLPPDETEPLTLDGAMAYIRKHTPTE